jgi:hypothetical protein
VAKRLDAIIAELLVTGPTVDEVRRVATRVVSGRISGLESVGGFGGKAVALAEGAHYANNPDFYKKQLAAYAAATPAKVGAVARKWLSRPVYALTVLPGERRPYEEAQAANPGTHHPDYSPKPRSEERARVPQAGIDRSKLPRVGPIANLDFPTAKRAKLSNGIEIVHAQRTAVPITPRRRQRR